MNRNGHAWLLPVDSPNWYRLHHNDPERVAMLLERFSDRCHRTNFGVQPSKSVQPTTTKKWLRWWWWRREGEQRKHRIWLFFSHNSLNIKHMNGWAPIKYTLDASAGNFFLDIFFWWSAWTASAKIESHIKYKWSNQQSLRVLIGIVLYISIGSYSHTHRGREIIYTEKRTKEKNMDDVFAFFSHYYTINTVYVRNRK